MNITKFLGTPFLKEHLRTIAYIVLPDFRLDSRKKRLVLQVFRSSLPEVNSQENRVPFYQSYSLKACNFTKGKLNFEHILDELKLFELKIIG